MNLKELSIAIIDFIVEHKEQGENDVLLPTELFTTGEASIQDLERNLRVLRENAAFETCEIEDVSSPSGNDTVIDVFRLHGVNLLALFEYKQKLLERTQNSIIKPKALEQIARVMGDHDGAVGLIKLLKDAGIPDYLIVYPNTKWCMIDDIFRVLVTSKDTEFHQLFFKVLEDFCHPLTFGGDKEKAVEMQDTFSSLLEYDGYCFDKNKIVKGTEAMFIDIQFRKTLRQQRAEKSFSQGIDAYANFFDSFSRPRPTKRPVVQTTKETPINITIQNNNQNIQTAHPGQVNASSSASESKTLQKKKEKDKVYFTVDENLEYNGEVFYELTPLQRDLCRKIFTEDVNHSFKTFDVEEEVYGGEATKDRQDRLKKTIARTNAAVQIEFEIPELIHYTSATIRRLA